CRARAKLPARVIEDVTTQVADGCEQRVPATWLWKGRHVHLVDGTTGSMPDTEENQAVYPQPNSQQEGLGFPIARMVVLLCLATAMVKGMAMGPYAGKETGENALLRELLGRLASHALAGAGDRFCRPPAPAPRRGFPAWPSPGRGRSRGHVDETRAPRLDGRGHLRADAGFDPSPRSARAN